jgi:catechol 2,3-dioxygenase-like lactoylglutathione lyase family enzyme
MSQSVGLDIGEIGQIALPVRDLDRAVAFYRDRLGLPFLFAYPPLAFLMAGSVRLMLSAQAASGASSSVIYFRVADVGSAHAALRAKGVAFVNAPHIVHRDPDHDLWMAFFGDGEGNTLALMEERLHA